MTKRLKKNIELLKLLKNCKTKQQKRILLELANKDLVYCVSDCCNNLLKGNIKLSNKKREQLKKFGPVIRELAARKTGIKKKKQLLIQKGGFLPALLTPIIGIASSLFGELVGNLVK